MRYTVEYGGVTYEQNGLDFADLLRFGTTIQPKIAGLTSTAAAITSEKAVVSSEVYSFYQTVEKIFSQEEWIYLIELFLVNERNLLSINGETLSTDEIKEHFRGDFLRMYAVAVKLAIKNLWESSPFMQSLDAFTKNIVESLGKLLKEKLETIETGLQKATRDRLKRS